MDKYSVKLTSRALRDLDEIYDYVSKAHLKPEKVIEVVNQIEKSIYSLETQPERCPERGIGAYANQGYRLLFMGHYIVAFRVNEAEETVIIVTVRYAPVSPPIHN